MPRLLLVLLALTLAGCGAREEATFELAPVRPGGPLGLADLEVRGGEVRGRVVAWGFAPGTRHAVTLGAGPCPGGRAGDRVVAELVANPNGVAFGRVRARAGDDPLADGQVLTIFGAGRDRPRTARVACGDTRGSARLRPADLSAVGPGGATRADVSGIVQVVRGRIQGEPPTLRARRGDTVALALRADLPDELAFAGLGLSVQVGPGTIARLSFTAARAGSFALRGRLAGSPLLLRLEVRA